MSPLSRVITRWPYCRAVAAMMRSAGSFGGSPGRKAESIRMWVVRPANRTPDKPSRRPSQTLGDTLRRYRPLATSIATSQAVIGETCTPAEPSCASRMARRLASLMVSPWLSHRQAQVSRRTGSVTHCFPDLADRLGEIDAFDRLHDVGQRAPQFLRLLVQRYQGS